MSIIAEIKKFWAEPSAIMPALLRRQLNAARGAFSLFSHGNVMEMFFDDRAEPERAAGSHEATVRRLHHNQLGLAIASRCEGKGHRNLVVLAFAILVLCSVVGYAAVKPSGLFSMLALVTGGLTALLAGIYYGIMALGLSPNSYWLLAPQGDMLTEGDIEAAERFTKQVLVRAPDVNAPRDLQDVFRPLTFDESGNPVDGQIVSADFVESYALKVAKETLFWVAGFAGVLLMLGLGAVMAATKTGPGIVFVGLAGALAMVGAFFAVVRSLVSPRIAERRAAIAHDVRQAAGLVKLFANLKHHPIARVAAARKAQIQRASADSSPILSYGFTTGEFQARGDLYAPDPGQVVAKSINDDSVHQLCFGETGSGKSTRMAIPAILQLMETDVGMAIFDAKDELPYLVAGSKDYVILSPGQQAYAALQNVSPVQFADQLKEEFGGSGGDNGSFFDAQAALQIRAAGWVVLLAKQIDASVARYTIRDIYRTFVDQEFIASLRETIQGDGEAQMELLAPHVREAYNEWLAFPKMPSEKTRESILSTIKNWLDAFLRYPELSAWIDAEEGILIEDVLQGARFGFSLPVDTFKDAAKVITKLAKARIYVAGRQRKHDWAKDPVQKPFYVHIDEAQKLVTADEADAVDRLRSKGGKVFLYTQSVSALYDAFAKLGSEGDKKVEALLANFLNVICLATGDQKTREFVCGRVGAAPRAVFKTVQAGANDAAGTMALLQLDAQHDADSAAGAAHHRSNILREIRRAGGTSSELGAILSGLITWTGIPTALKNLGLVSRQKAGLGQVEVGVMPIITPDEFDFTLRAPGAAIAIINRGGVKRSDVVMLEQLGSADQLAAFKQKFAA